MSQQTSLEAYKSIQHRIISLKEQVLILIRKKNGLTCDEVEQLIQGNHQTISARINDLMKEGSIIDSNKRRKTRSGRDAIVWVQNV